MIYDTCVLCYLRMFDMCGAVLCYAVLCLGLFVDEYPKPSWLAGWLADCFNSHPHPPPKAVSLPPFLPPSTLPI